MRAGTYVTQLGGYKAFIPKPLSPDPPITMDSEMIDLLSLANRTLGRLDGATETLPNPDLFVAMYVRKEAVLSSQIEGTQASLIDVLEYESKRKPPATPNEVGEVVNHVKAMNYGLARLQDLPVCLRLIRELHAVLLEGVRGSDRGLGEFRTTQNWVGPPGSTLATALYVPPPIPEMNAALDDLEKYLHAESRFPILIKCGIIHSQFETIHPFLDGNGRIGRLLITFLLCHQKILQKPLLYLSYYFKEHRGEYYDRLQVVRDTGDWEGWLKFFLRGISETSKEALDTARKILALQEDHKKLIAEKMRGASYAFLLLEMLYHRPFVDVNTISRELNINFATANNLVKKFVNVQLLRETTGRHRDRRFIYEPYIEILKEAT